LLKETISQKSLIQQIKFMKNIFKTISKTTFICFLAILSGCEAEKDVVKNNKLTIRSFSMNDAANKGNSKLMEAVQKVKTMRPADDSENARIVLDVKSGLFFDDEKGIYIETADKKSYTFPIITSSPTEDVKNICFNEKSDGNYDVYIVKYDFTKEEAENMTTEQLMLREKVYMQLVKDGVPLTTLSIVCVEILELIEISEFEGVYDGDATQTEVQWVVIDVFCYNAAGDDYDGFNYGSGDGNPENPDTGGGVDTGIVTGTIIGDTEAQAPGSLPLGFMMEYFENNLDEFALPIYQAHPELREYLAANNCTPESRLFALEMIALFQSEEYTQEQKETISELIAICANNNASVTIHNPVNDNNVTIEELQNQLDSNLSANLLEIETIPTIDNGFIGRCKITINPLYSVRIAMNFSTNANGQYTLTKENVSSELSGLTAFTEWTQLPNQCNVNNNSNGRIRVELYGKLQQHYTIPPFEGIKITRFIRIIILIDKNTGEIISSEWYFD
jgi:hypothetical protein